jgi:hypothetical protein
MTFSHYHIWTNSPYKTSVEEKQMVLSAQRARIPGGKLVVSHDWGRKGRKAQTAVQPNTYEASRKPKPEPRLHCSLSRPWHSRTLLSAAELGLALRGLPSASAAMGADSDEEDFVAYGTPIEREEDTSARRRRAIAEAGQLRALPAWKQEVWTAPRPHSLPMYLYWPGDTWFPPCVAFNKLQRRAISGCTIGFKGSAMHVLFVRWVVSMSTLEISVGENALCSILFVRWVVSMSTTCDLLFSISIIFE